MISYFEATAAVYYISKQIFLDLAGLLEGNLTALLNSTIEYVAWEAGVIYDGEAILEKVIVLLTS
jgi:hypothetical protein